MTKLEYKQRQLEFEESAKTPSLRIDGQPVQVSHDPEAASFSAGELPYRTFQTVRELAQAVVEERQARQQGGKP